MMKRERSGISLLLGLLLAFSMAVGLVHSVKTSGVVPEKVVEAAQITATSAEPAPSPSFTVPELPAVPQPQAPSPASAQPTAGGLATVSVDEAIEILKPLLSAQGIQKAVDVMRDIPASVAVSLLQKILHNKLVSPDKVLQVLAGVALHYANPQEQAVIFDLLLHEKDLLRGTAPLYHVAQSSFVAAVAPFLAWAQKKQQLPQDQAAVLRALAYDACAYAIKENDYKTLNALLKHGVSLSPDMATQLLWQAVAGSKKVKIAKLLIAHGAQVNHAKEGKTLLIKAIENHNLGLVKALMAAQADPNLIVLPAVGTALQVLLELQRSGGKAKAEKLIKIEEFLRSHGARE
ncbi:MAG TPA: ankyrin repeat domain-containing protein [Candidatus Limnocylindria bacterium]|nr:ankyrin repeat domain-containing protein [Candidatus Limnocylindria bacterium]